MQKPFENASFALKIGYMTGIVDTDSEVILCANRIMLYITKHFFLITGPYFPHSIATNRKHHFHLPYQVLPQV